MIRVISSAQDGRSTIRPATWPDGIRPASGRPSAIAARSSTGVFAAISTWPQVSPVPRRIARPSRSSAGHPSLDARRNALALRAERTRALTRPARSRRSVSGVRSSRCGTPSARVVTTVPVTSLAR